MKQNILIFTLIITIISCIPVLLWAQPSPIGEWYTRHPDFNEYTSITRIYTTPSGTLAGKVVKMLPIDGKMHYRCTKCHDELKNKRFVGMDVIWGFKANNIHRTWVDGRILDGKRGLIVPGKMWLSHDGNTLFVMGHIGPFSATVRWDRKL